VNTVYLVGIGGERCRDEAVIYSFRQAFVHPEELSDTYNTGAAYSRANEKSHIFAVIIDSASTESVCGTLA
jgi:hypothetical protein